MEQISESRERWWGFGLLVVALLVTVAACGTQAGDTGGDQNGATTTATGAVEPQVVAVHEGVLFYPACGNEVLRHEGVDYYSLLPEEDVTVLRLGRGAGVSIHLVAPPGPGDDVGTLTIYSDGFAHFVSDSGDLDVWLTQEFRNYNWVC